ncbi:hypothetical protein [Oryzobacter terrae]|uniref:hypothetical protein n=1 Tax=Oryzobacter terrae TaxID=1620385 RepID=UPI00366C3AFA
MHGGRDARHEAAVRASLHWYEDVFALHGIPTTVADGLWRALGEPPRWHSAAKTLRPDVSVDQVRDAVAGFGHCSVADSYGTLDLGGAGFERLFTASWLHLEPLSEHGGWPPGWGTVDDEGELERWNDAFDTSGVLLPSMLGHPRFTVLACRAGGALVGGAVLHRTGEFVELSNCWAVGDGGEDIASMVACAGILFPQRPLVGYARGEELDRWCASGFRRTGPQVVWVR